MQGNRIVICDILNNLFAHFNLIIFIYFTLINFLKLYAKLNAYKASYDFHFLHELTLFTIKVCVYSI